MALMGIASLSLMYHAVFSLSVVQKQEGIDRQKQDKSKRGTSTTPPCSASTTHVNGGTAITNVGRTDNAERVSTAKAEQRTKARRADKG